MQSNAMRCRVDKLMRAEEANVELGVASSIHRDD